MGHEQEYRYRVVDVFTENPLEGNALAVFPEASSIDAATMQRIARELNLAETAFVLPSTRKDCAARVRIFTPAKEMLFAGHPTIGTAFVLLDEGRVPDGTGDFLLEENIGPVPVRVETGARPMLWLRTPSIETGRCYDPGLCASVLGLTAQDLLDIAPQKLSAGNPTIFVALRDKPAVDRAWLDLTGMRQLRGSDPELACVFVFTPTAQGAYSRMFAPEYGVAEDPATGKRRDLKGEERRAFWAWAAVEVLRLTGVRIEELTELSHHSLIQYWLPATRELVPLLQIAPSKTDEERLLVISPELADVLAAIVTRVREPGGGIPLVSAYDTHEKVWNPPMPLLFQWHWRLEDRPLSPGAIRRLLNDTLAGSGLTDASGVPLRFTPHDFRRLFITDAVMHGMPPHIAQLVAGHRDINTTMGYKAVYPEEVINGHRAFIARRRSLRPGEEYRTPTDAEWEEFLGHFERRRVALGECGRSYSTPCIHEHSCLRCPLLRPSPAQRPRVAEIRGNLLDRIAEAGREGWHGEVEGLRVSLAGAEAKLAQLDQMARRAATVHLGMPVFGEIAGRAALSSSKDRP